MDPREITAAAVDSEDGSAGTPTGVPLTPEAKEKISGCGGIRRGNSAARGRYAPVQPYGESVNYEQPATSQPEALMLDYLRRRTSVPTDLLGIIVSYVAAGV